MWKVEIAGKNIWKVKLWNRNCGKWTFFRDIHVYCAKLNYGIKFVEVEIKREHL